MVGDRNTVILYTAAVCNLNCRYCYIDKNSALVKIDNLLGESFRGDYYYDFIREMFPDPAQLTDLQTWGGEPFLAMGRLHNTLGKIIPEYPGLKNLFSSTNMAFPEWTDQFYGLMAVMGGYPGRRFNYCLQVSLDGPEAWTDRTRGAGTTEKLLVNYHKMLSMLGGSLPGNVNLTIVFKPTLDLETVRFLDSEQAIVNYYKIFDGLIDDAKLLGYSNVTALPPLPNTACPCPATKDDGEFFAGLCRMTRGIERQGSILRHCRAVTPFSGGAAGDVRDTLKYPHFTCGTGYTHLGLLPGHMVSTCHNGFVDMAAEYKKLAAADHGDSTIDPRLFMSTHKHRMIFNKDDYPEYENQMSCYNCPGTSARVATVAAQIMLLAQAGQVLPEYQDTDEAIKAAVFYQSHTAYCVRDNHATTGSLTTVHNGLLKLLFNGAHQFLERKGDVHWIG